MKISTSTYAMCNRLSQEEAIRAIAEAGFNAFDISLERLQKKDNTPYTMDYARELRALADGLGIECNQAHAPFPSSVGDTQKDAEIYKSIIFAMEFAAENYGYANQFPLELMPAAEKLLCSVGKYLASEIEKNRKNEREAI